MSALVARGAAAPTVLILNQPANPTGATYTRRRAGPHRRGRARRGHHRHFRRDLRAPGLRRRRSRRSPRCPGMRGRTVTVNGFSKAFAMTGLAHGVRCRAGPADGRHDRDPEPHLGQRLQRGAARRAQGARGGARRAGGAGAAREHEDGVPQAPRPGVPPAGRRSRASPSSGPAARSTSGSTCPRTTAGRWPAGGSCAIRWRWRRTCWTTPASPSCPAAPSATIATSACRSPPRPRISRWP